MIFSTACPWIPRSRLPPSLQPRHLTHPRLSSSPPPPPPPLPALPQATGLTTWKMEAPSAPSSTRCPAWNSATRAACWASRVCPRLLRTWLCLSCRGVGDRAQAAPVARAPVRHQQQWRQSLAWAALCAAWPPIRPPARSRRQLSAWARRAGWTSSSPVERTGIQVEVVDWWANPPEGGYTRVRRSRVQGWHTLWRLVVSPCHLCFSPLPLFSSFLTTSLICSKDACIATYMLGLKKR